MDCTQYYFETPYAALMFDELEEYEDLIGALTTFIHRGQSSGAAYHNRGIAYYWEIGKFEEALEDLTMAESAVTDNHLPSQMKGMIQRELGRLDEAMKSLNRAVAISPDAAAVRRTRASMLFDAGRLGSH